MQLGAVLSAVKQRSLPLGLVALALAAWLLWPSALGVKAPTWQALLHPLAPGAELVPGYRLAPPKLGFESDVVFTAENAERLKVEIHVLRRGQWSSEVTTPSFDIAYEAPRSTAPVEVSMAATRTLADALRKRDPGALLPTEVLSNRAVATPLERSLGRLGTPRGLAAMGALGVGLVAVAHAAPCLAVALVFALGLWLRATELGLPFALDQDIQRAFTGHLPLADILFGRGLQDRHPPLYFVVLHVAQWFGQSEAVLRAPAALAGAAVGPLLYLFPESTAQRRAPLLALAALSVALSPTLIQSSREVSDIPLFTLLMLVALASVTRTGPAGRARDVLVTVSHGLLLWTYYLAPLVVAGECAALWWLRRPVRFRPLLLGLLLGSPALLLALGTFFRDRPARLAAAQTPGIAWGERGALGMTRELVEVASGAFGPALLAAALALGAWALWRRQRVAGHAWLIALSVFCGLALLAPVARLQPYYLASVAPLLPLILASFEAPSSKLGRWLPGAVTLLLFASLLGVTRPKLVASSRLWRPDSDAMGPAVAAAVAKERGSRVITVMHNDTTTLAYYLGRLSGRELDWDDVQLVPGRVSRLPFKTEVVPLMFAHAAGASEAASAAELRRLRALGPVLVLDRPQLALPQIRAVLADCRPVHETTTARLVRCK